MRLAILLMFFSNSVFAQYWGGQEISDSNLVSWLAKSVKEYQGNYHFGESESESDFILFFSGEYIIGQVKRGYWEENTGLAKSDYITLTNIEIDTTGKFTSDQHTGQFVKYKTENGQILECLKINNPWSSWIEDSAFEIGTRTKLIFENIYYGKYGKASFQKLTTEELNKNSTEELSLMRNEIFARYGYIFSKGGKMDTYFSNQDWYRAAHKNVNNFLTELERFNIELIKRLE